MVPLRVVLPSDVFPPRCGGAGWSAHALALALIRRGHAVTAVVPRQGMRGVWRGDVLGVPTLGYGYWAPRVPFVQNYFRHERLWVRLADVLVAEGAGDVFQGGRLLLHAQHVQTAPAAVRAARRLGVPVVVNVRDHWPWDYFATGLHGGRLPYEGQTWAAFATDLVARLGPGRGSMALVAVPYLLAHMRRRQEALRCADAVIVGSRYMAQRLRGVVVDGHVHVIPNAIDGDAIAEVLAEGSAGGVSDGSFLLYVGKLEHNKGAGLLVEVFRMCMAAYPQVRLPRLVIAGSGPLRAEVAAGMAQIGAQVDFLDWAEHDVVLRLMARCRLLLFPSRWGEPLSRVLLEAMACGAPILAMPTGGTGDIIADGVNGALEVSVAGFARRLAVLLEQPADCRALGARAQEDARLRFDQGVVAQQVEEVYRSVLQAQARGVSMLV